jgi:hypothetical protein
MMTFIAFRHQLIYWTITCSVGNAFGIAFDNAFGKALNATGISKESLINLY